MRNVDIYCLPAAHRCLQNDLFFRDLVSERIFFSHSLKIIFDISRHVEEKRDKMEASGNFPRSF